MNRLAVTLGVLAVLSAAGCQLHRCAHCHHLHAANVFGGWTDGAVRESWTAPVPEPLPMQQFPPPPAATAVPMGVEAPPAIPEGPRTDARDVPEAPRGVPPANTEVGPPGQSPGSNRSVAPAPERSDDVRIVPPAGPEPPPLPEPDVFVPTPSFPILDGPAS